MFKSALVAFVCSASLSAYARADDHKQLNVPAGELITALKALAQQSGVELVYRSEQLEGLRTRGVTGALSPEDAVRKLLEGTPLTLKMDSSGAMLIARPTPTAPKSTSLSTDSPVQVAGDAQGVREDSAKEGASRKSFWDRFRLAQADQGQVHSDGSVVPASEPSQTGDRAKLEEIVVTAQKREQRLRDVPVPVTAISGEDLVSTSKLRLQDFFSSIPGFNVMPANQSSQLLSIRGITTGNGNPTVGIVIDDVPYGSSTQLGGAALVPDIDPGDLQRVEVLRGPQGTLYGASSMGGLLKFVTVDPSTESTSARIEAGANRVASGSAMGYNVRASGNLPLSDSFAVRLSGFSRTDPGYVDNVNTGAEDVNEAKVRGGRLSALWRPSSVVSLKLSALYQDTKGDGTSDVDVQPGLGSFEQNYLPGTGGYERKSQAYSAVLDAKAGRFDITSLTGYNVNQYSDVFDFAFAFGPGVALLDDNTTRKFTQELRVSTPLGEHFDWLLGAFYTHEDSDYVQSLANAAATGDLTPLGFTQSGPTTYREYAGFTNLTIHFTNRFDLQLGARESDIRQGYSQSQEGAMVGPAPILFPELETSGNAFTYLVTPQLKMSSDLMIYARLASGYRAGGPNTSPGGIVPTEYDPDETQTYELGIKGDFLDHRLSIDASLYRIDWKDIQISLANNSQTYNANAGRAKSQGFELSTEARPLSGLRIAAWAAWTDAELTQDTPANARSLYGVSGERLPYSARISGSLSLDQELLLSEGVVGLFGASVNYVGDRKGTLRTSVLADRQSYGGYARTDVHAGARVNDWTVNLFVNNVTDRRGIINGGIGYAPEFAFIYIQPRTAGLTVSRWF